MQYSIAIPPHNPLTGMCGVDLFMGGVPCFLSPPTRCVAKNIVVDNLNTSCDITHSVTRTLLMRYEGGIRNARRKTLLSGRRLPRSISLASRFLRSASAVWPNTAARIGSSAIAPSSSSEPSRRSKTDSRGLRKTDPKDTSNSDDENRRLADALRSYLDAAKAHRDPPPRAEKMDAGEYKRWFDNHPQKKDKSSKDEE